MKTPKQFLGTWRITETEVWGKDALLSPVIRQPFHDGAHMLRVAPVQAR